ncbi:L,D-transpeptidase [Nocardia stercoris]|uniref:L,D-TPase catalytic domain-containing protein n=1 Tax=Nocardia stercoris TaxID=2483361 RepID=A0A3M2L5V3_9NOCA|nr:Ig-like domain-containing protein [Nocardia stercoris]RMI32991.1 hypothetical protein EBN03_12090 [Nocardia stercoris]
MGMKIRGLTRLAGPTVALLLVAVVTAGCGGSRSNDSAGHSGAQSVAEILTPKLDLPAENGAVDVGVDTLLPVRIEQGKLTAVTLTGPNGAVAGTLAPDGTSWHANDKLAFGAVYRLQTAGVGLGKQVFKTVSFTTIAPEHKTHPYLTPDDGEVVGIGQPVAVAFDEDVPNRYAVQKAISVTTVPPVEGAFYWVNNREVRWRPEHFWAQGTKVTVHADLYGHNLGGGLLPDSDLDATFTVGDATVFHADDNTKLVTVERNGQVIRTMPTSMGKESSPTTNGIYILSDRHQQIIMDSTTFGLPSGSPGGYRTPVDWATRMSYSGIFMHSAPWSVWAQGSTDTSHGCLNLSPEDAEWVYDNAKRGDIAIVSNTVGDTLSGIDGLGDWNVPWADWKAGNAGGQ